MLTRRRSPVVDAYLRPFAQLHRDPAEALADRVDTHGSHVLRPRPSAKPRALAKLLENQASEREALCFSAVSRSAA